MSLRAFAIAALGEPAPEKFAGTDCPSGTPLGVSRWDSMQNQASGTIGTHGTGGTYRTSGTIGTIADESERLALALELGKVPPNFADAFARLPCQSLPGIPPDWQARAADMAGRLLDHHGAELVRLAWPVGAIFDTPVMLATSGQSAALDLRKAGLAWQMREGNRITRLASDGAMIRQADGTSWFYALRRVPDSRSQLAQRRKENP